MDGTAQSVFPHRFFQENLGLSDSGGRARQRRRPGDVRATGASVMGKRMFDPGEKAWPEEAPFHTPVFVVTHKRRNPWKRPGGTTFHFVSDGIASAFELARETAGNRASESPAAARPHRVRERRPGRGVSVALSPVLFGSGKRLFEGVDAGRVALEPVRAEPSPRVTHLTYAVRER